MQIAIDGPAGSGKSTIAKQLAQSLRFTYIDTGAMYRALTLCALKQGISCADEQSLSQLAAKIPIDLSCCLEGQQRVLCEGQDVTEKIRAPIISEHVSQVSSHEGVRRELVKKQQALALNRDVIMDGRDIGTVVLPQAQCKIFLTASLEERVRRRFTELLDKGYSEDYDTLRKQMARRDQEDAHREVGPLKPSPEAIILDTTHMTLEQVGQRILEICQLNPK